MPPGENKGTSVGLATRTFGRKHKRLLSWLSYLTLAGLFFML